MSIKLGVRYEGNGYFRAVARHGVEEAESKFEKGEVLKAELTRPRSTSQNNLFHALVEAAYDNQRDGPQFDSWRQLRSWLLIRAGKCERWELAPNAMTKEVAKIFRAHYDTVDVTQSKDGKKLILKFVRSVSFDKMSHEEFTETFDQCVDIICAEIVPGADREKLLEMVKKGAA